jgi:O-antigen/teichoic acid export membrane protein
MPFLLVFLGIITTIYFTNWLTIYHAFAIYAAALLLVILIQRLAIKKIAPKDLAIAKPKYLTQDWNKVSRHLLIAELTFVGISSIDLIMLKFLGVDFAEVGIFAAAVTICNSIMLVSMAVNIGTAPIISVYMKKYFHNKQRLQHFVNLCNILLVIPTVLLTTVIIIFGRYFLHAFGLEFVKGYWVLVIILISYAISVILGTSFTVLRYTKHQGAIVNSNILALLLMITIEALLVPYYGYYGAAIGLAFSRIAMALWFMIVVKKEFGIKPFFIL